MDESADCQLICFEVVHVLCDWSDCSVVVPLVMSLIETGDEKQRLQMVGLGN